MEPDQPGPENGGENPTRELPAAPGSSEDRCTACGSSLAHDQRYCVECGERRGQSGFPVAQPPADRAAKPKRRLRSPGPRAQRVSSGTTLVAGVGVLLLAIGLGVLIGRVGNDQPQTRAASPQAITIQGGGGGVGATTPTTRTTVHLTKKAKNKLKAAAASTAPPSAAVQQKATRAAGKVLGNSQNLAPPTSTVGGKCSGAKAGCSGGKFTGNFFGQ